MKNFWLVKQEPSAYSWSDFVAEGQTAWRPQLHGAK
jgi:predicted RNA-binding protein with PUA-like domain